MNNKQYFYIICDNTNVLKFKPNEYKLLPDNYIQIKDNEPYPIEDSNFLFSNIELTENEAFNKWVERI